ncbi:MULTISPECIES: hypothetical protein [Paenibacillus]|uniref:Uncharacterized protein n=1 Tax=Paenibacillus lautus TaxID=1401 RepID=A0A1R1A5J3_PAELA|nr:hypothetical protein [Paenibacillus lautus]OME80832.1 hypothetical protein BK123_34305 [Paenibacillus lautus]
MHTTKDLRSEDFTITVDGSNAVWEDIFPVFHKHDRLGIVVKQPGGAIGASGLILAYVTRFYDFYRDQLGNAPDRLRIYPEIFVFHVGSRMMDHSSLDVWPPHKEVIVHNEPEQVLEAINDRGITRLLVEDMLPLPANFLRETVSSAMQRIVSAMAYSSKGCVNHADISISSSPAAEKYVMASINASGELSEMIREKLRLGQKARSTDCIVTDTYRRIQISDAIHMLSHSNM